MLQQNFFLVTAITTVACGLVFAGVDRPSEFTNQGGISNTRHNLTQRTASSPTLNSGIMDPYRNDYGEVCVYCHTPHGASTVTTVPLWNRTLKATTYTTYNQLGTSSLTQTVSQPGAASLSCLSCHDGQTAVDSIINMPGSDRYKQSQETASSVDQGFLDSWPGATSGMSHMALNGAECLACHSTVPPYGMTVGLSAADFTAAAIGTDLKNDHPVGVTFPTVNGAGTDFNTPGGSRGNVSFFDANNDSRLDKMDVRVYEGKVECASCHDPHGVPGAGPNSSFNPTFLRVSNVGSVLCLTCHSK